MAQGAIQVERHGGVGLVTLNRPDRSNAFDQAMAAELRGAVQALAKDPDVGALVLTGAGKAFCAGGDAQAMRQGFAGKGGAKAVFLGLTGQFHPLIHALATMPKPVIAAVNGAAAGGGFPLALACDLRIASPHAKFKPAYLTLGVVPDGGLMWMLPRFVGPGKAREIVLTDATILADQALALGLVNEVVEPARVVPRALELAQRMAEGPRFAIAQAKALLAKGERSTLKAHLDAERKANAASAALPDFQEGLRAFEEKRPPRFGGRKAQG
jgi:2-(1,2-epoxy-1,2-dihydrophenyl)acetyl-CoA isomerase